MIVEHEVIEQIEEDPTGWAFGRVCALIRALGKDPFHVLRGMWKARLVALVDANGVALTDHRCEEVLRAQDENEDIRIAATDDGSALAHRG